MAITLREIDRSNWAQCVRLQVSEEQRHFVASNVFSLAQACYEPECRPLAIYAGEEMVGFLMYAQSPEDGHWWIYRLMIDHRHQGKGYGRAAMEQILARLKALPGCDRVRISYEPENVAAERLYESMGFRKTGEIVGGEVVAQLTW